MAIRITHEDWLIARKYGCKVSYSAFQAMYDKNWKLVDNVVAAWCVHFMEFKK